MKIKKIGAIDLTYNLWWTNYDATPSIQSEVASTINGGTIVWEQPYDVSSINISISSGENGWQTVAVKDAIQALVAASLGATTTITTAMAIMVVTGAMQWPGRLSPDSPSAC